jgi:hypothetical protein
MPLFDRERSRFEDKSLGGYLIIGIVPAYWNFFRELFERFRVTF